MEARQGAARRPTQQRKQLRAARTQFMRDEETTLPRMTGDALLLMSTTTSESEPWPVTYAYEPLTATSRAFNRRDDETTLPRMTGDAGLLMSITTSELERPAAT